MRFYRKGSFYFVLLILVFFALLFVISFGYDRTTRLVPQVIMAPALLLTLYSLAGEFYPRLLRSFDVRLINLRTASTTDGVTVSFRASKLLGNRGLFIVISWLAGYFVLLLLVGFLIATPVALLLFLRAFGDQNWPKSLLITAATWALMYGVFEVLMRFELFRGILFGEIVLF